MKTKTERECPFCSYKSWLVPAIINHIKGAHPDKWKGTWAETIQAVGLEDPGIRRKRRMIEKQREMRQRNILAGLTAKGTKRKLALRKGYTGPKPDVMPERQASGLPMDRLFLMKHKHNRAMRLRNLLAGKTSSGEKRQRPLKPEVLKRYPELVAALATAEGLKVQAEFAGAARSGKNDIAAASTPETVTQVPDKPAGPVRSHIDWCPDCGCNIKYVEEAKGLREWMVATGKLPK